MNRLAMPTAFLLTAWIGMTLASARAQAQAPTPPAANPFVPLVPGGAGPRTPAFYPGALPAGVPLTYRTYSGHRYYLTPRSAFYPPVAFFRPENVQWYYPLNR